MPEFSQHRIRRSFHDRWDRHYTAAKLRSDPLYVAVLGELRESALPLLDIGGGLGLLAFYLRDHGVRTPILTLDYDRRKIEAATRAAAERGEQGLEFAVHDARGGLPEHSGNVSILDILQFFSPDECERLLVLAAKSVPARGKLVIRSGLRDDSWRFKVTVAGDLVAKATCWMPAAPRHYPSAADFERILSPFGKLRISPLWGSTPFNNHLVVLDRD